eukprot:scaffold264012_cov32-Tisochrysis_lutea.AAC.4
MTAAVAAPVETKMGCRAVRNFGWTRSPAQRPEKMEAVRQPSTARRVSLANADPAATPNATAPSARRTSGARVRGLGEEGAFADARAPTGSCSSSAVVESLLGLDWSNAAPARLAPGCELLRPRSQQAPAVTAMFVQSMTTQRPMQAAIWSGARSGAVASHLLRSSAPGEKKPPRASAVEGAITERPQSAPNTSSMAKSEEGTARPVARSRRRVI